MAYITPQTQSLKVCFQNHYSLPYFQREYKWESRHVGEMLNDIQAAFLLSHDPVHQRKEVSNYAPYFLGSIITSVEANGKRPLIDGQQRMTTMFVLLAYLDRYRADNNVSNAADIAKLLGSVSFGQMDYSLEFSLTRKAIFDLYRDENKIVSDALKEAEELPNLEDGDKKLLEALRTIDALLDSNVRKSIAYFIDYVVERVLLIDIAVSSEAEAHRVFVTMNDRGLRLGPIDLLKGQILSKIQIREDAQSCHQAWSVVVNKLRAIDPEEDSLFFRNLLRAKWALTIRGKAKGDAPGDFDVIGDAYHRWFDENSARLSIKTSDDYVEFARDHIPKFADIYIAIKRAEENFTSGFESIFYNSARRYSFQTMVLMSVVKVSDSTSDWHKKVTLVARYIDAMLTARTIEGKENNYDNLKEISFALTKEIRDKDYLDLFTYIQTEWAKLTPVIPQVANLKYTKSERSDVLYVLARLGCYLEDAFSLTTKVGFVTYWQRDRGSRTFDIEHLLKDKFDLTALPATHGFVDAKEYGEIRNLLGALILLPRSRNRSLQDQPYRDKLSVYATENALSQTLCESFYRNHPNVMTFSTANKEMGLKEINDFGKLEIAKRANLYVEIAKKVWEAPS